MYYIWANGAQNGPYTVEQMRSMWAAGQVTAQMLYWQDGMAQWTPCANLAPLFQPVPAVPMPGMYVPPPVPTGTQALHIPTALLRRRLIYAFFALSILSFFLPVASVSLPIVGKFSISFADLLSSKHKSASDTGQFDMNAGSAPGDIFNELKTTKQENGGAAIVGFAFLLLGLHYLLTIAWGVVTFALKTSFKYLDIIWIACGVQFAILFSIGASMALHGLSQSTGESGNPFAGIGQLVANNISIDAGGVTWLVMLLGGACLYFTFAKKSA